MFGRFLELSIACDDIAASVTFYEALGFRQLACTDAWPYPYCVLSDGRLCIGLHRRRAPALALAFVRTDLATHTRYLEHAGLVAYSSRLSSEDFHELRLRDPAGQEVVLLEARTFSPDPEPYRESLCGYFAAFSMPSGDFDAARAFWERAGFIAHSVQDDPFPHLPITGNHLSLALHAPATLITAALVFSDPDMAQRIGQLHQRDLEFSTELPRGLAPESNALLVAPEGTLLLLTSAEY
jgi:catechol 2,3-dioxygenase-like lactoylglutathione lyase family enzyme